MDTQTAIKFKPEQWHNQYEIDSAWRYDYVAPNGTLWNASGIVGGIVQLWTINAWGQFYYEHVDEHRFRNTWREYHGR